MAFGITLGGVRLEVGVERKHPPKEAVGVFAFAVTVHF
jgi:hypothetical protein